MGALKEKMRTAMGAGNPASDREAGFIAGRVTLDHFGKSPADLTWQEAEEGRIVGELIWNEMKEQTP